MAGFQVFTVAGMNAGCSSARTFLCCMPSIARMIRPSNTAPRPSAMKPLVKFVESFRTAMMSWYLKSATIGRVAIFMPALVGTPNLPMKSPAQTGCVCRISLHSA